MPKGSLHITKLMTEMFVYSRRSFKLFEVFTIKLELRKRREIEKKDYKSLNQLIVLGFYPNTNLTRLQLECHQM